MGFKMIEIPSIWIERKVGESRFKLFSFLPALFNKDGNPNLYGYVFNSIIFGLLYSLLIKGLSSIKS